MLGTSGNLSILISAPRASSTELKFLITASGKDKGELTEDDFILVGENGAIASEAKQSRSYNQEDDRDCFVANAPCSDKPSAETLLHAAIYKCTAGKAVFHVHTTNSSLLSMRNAECGMQNLEFEELEMLKGLGFKTHDVKVTIPVIENSQDMQYLASIIPNYTNEDVPGFLLRGHGLYAWGKTTQEAKRHVEIFEFLFEYRVKELMLKKHY